MNTAVDTMSSGNIAFLKTQATYEWVFGLKLSFYKCQCQAIIPIFGWVFMNKKRCYREAHESSLHIDGKSNTGIKKGSELAPGGYGEAWSDL